MKKTTLIIAAAMSFSVAAHDLGGPLYTPNYSEIDDTPIGRLIKSIAISPGSDRSIQSKINLFIANYSSNYGPDKAGAFRGMGFKCTEELCEYDTLFRSELRYEEKISRSVERYHISGKPNKTPITVDVKYTLIRKNPIPVGAGAIADFIHIGAPFESGRDLEIAITKFISSKSDQQIVDADLLKSLGLQCSEKCVYSTIINMDVVKGGKVEKLRHDYSITLTDHGQVAQVQFMEY